MGLGVFSKYVVSGETFTASLALVRSFPRVSARVRVHRTLCCERPRTELTVEGFLAGMRSHVHVQIVAPTEMFRTHRTFERLCAGVRFLVDRQFFLQLVFFPALLAFVMFLRGVHGFLVVHEDMFQGEGFATFVARVWSFFCVRAEVAIQLLLGVEFFHAEVAGEGSVVEVGTHVD